MAEPDPYRLGRFIDAQERVMPHVLDELRSGRKTAHWMWFVFPQIAGLGMSAMSQKFAIGSVGEARAFLAHSVLGPRLIECVELVLVVDGRSAHDIFGSPDDMKLRSCLTLFAHVSDVPVFRRALDRYFGGAHDPATVARLAQLR